MERLVYQESRKQEIIEQITVQAAASLPQDAKVENLEEDWIAHFLNSATLCLIKRCSPFGLAFSLEKRVLQVHFPRERSILCHQLTKRTLDLFLSPTRCFVCSAIAILDLH